MAILINVTGPTPKHKTEMASCGIISSSKGYRSYFKILNMESCDHPNRSLNPKWQFEVSHKFSLSQLYYKYFD